MSAQKWGFDDFFKANSVISVFTFPHLATQAFWVSEIGTDSLQNSVVLATVSSWVQCSSSFFFFFFLWVLLCRFLELESEFSAFCWAWIRVYSRLAFEIVSGFAIVGKGNETGTLMLHVQFTID